MRCCDPIEASPHGAREDAFAANFAADGGNYTTLRSGLATDEAQRFGSDRLGKPRPQLSRRTDTCARCG